jgi:hypothetical protein
MTCKLVLIHGRAQEGKDSKALKAEWLEDWKDGLGADLPIVETDIRFPFYGDTLDDLVKGKPKDQVAEIVIRGMAKGSPEQIFMASVLEEVRKKARITEKDLAREVGADVVQRGPLNWEWLQGILEVIDRKVPGASGTSIALATYDVYCYLNRRPIEKQINDGVRKAIEPGVPTVVVAHSLGTVVAYKLLREGKKLGWKIPLFVTVGSPLAVTAIRDSLLPTEVPECVTKWFNAVDPRDIVALYALDNANFNVRPGKIENKIDVKNGTENHHGISGYLGDKEVAKRIGEAVAA